MFLKKTKSSGHTYLQITQSYRDGDTPRHKVLLNLGRLDQLQDDASFKGMVVKLAELVQLQMSENEDSFSLGQVKGQQVLNWGYVVYQKLWRKFGLDLFFSKLQGVLNLQYDLGTTVFFEVANHLLQPCSKRAGYCKREQYAGLEPPEDLNAYYRCLDVLAENKESIEQHIFERNLSLFNMHVDVVLYDVTTFHFESVQEDELKRFGFSKAGKPNEVQVVLGLLVDTEGRPVGYELFSGNTFDAKTLERVLEGLKSRFRLGKVIVVADRGINSKMNLKMLKDKGYGYVMASRLKSMPQKVQQEAKDRSQGWIKDASGLEYKVLSFTNAVRDVPAKQTYALAERVVVTYSEKRRKKDACDRERLVAKAQKLLEKPSSIQAQFKRGGKKYLAQVKEAKGSRWFLNEKAIAQDQQWDGLYAIQSSELELDAKRIVEIYHELWRIEESFRVMKSTLEVRPIFHWTPKRIEGHFVMCFLAFLLERTLEWLAREHEIEATPEKMKEALNSLQLCSVSYQHQDYYLKMQGDKLGNQLVRMLRIKPPANVSRKKDWKI